MLILTRKLNESITLQAAQQCAAGGRGEPITITVTHLGPGKVKLGIDAADGVEILRTEILAKRPAAANASREATPAEVAA